MDLDNCPCCSNKSFDECCGPFIAGKKYPETAEALMRSRYTAFTKLDMDYIQKTLAPESYSSFDKDENRDWAAQAKWKGLKILKTEKGSATDKKGVVEFIATYGQGEDVLEHHEVSQFRKDANGHWLFVDGEAHSHREGEGHQHHHEKPQTIRRETPKVGRNDPCPCGSGKKYKKCCG